MSRRIATCDEHRVYTRGCPGCKERGRLRAEKRRRYLYLEGPMHISAQGTTRRLQALAVNGWTTPRMAEASGLSRATLLGVVQAKYELVDRRLAARVAAFYENAWDVKHIDGYGRRQTKWALKKGWVPPAAWDDIDNDPAPAELVKDKPMSIKEKQAEAAFLAAGGLSEEQIADKLGVTVYVMKSWAWPSKQRGEAA